MASTRMISESGPERDNAPDSVGRAPDSVGRAPDSVGRAPDASGGTPGGPERERANPAAGPRIIPLRGARGVNAPALAELPPPDGVEALYYEGMAAYQHRHWEEALDRFSQLKELQPSRPGLDALLDEVRWFLQLQAAAPTNGPSEGQVEKKARGWKGWRKRVLTGVYLGLGVLAIAGLLLVAFGDRLPWRGNRAAEELYNRGQARLTVGDYEGAQAAFEKMLEIAPNDPEALLGLDRAKRQQTLAQGYNAAQAAMTEEDWDRAATELTAILAIDPSYRDTRALSERVNQMRRLASLYADGGRLYDLGQWSEALAQFEKVRSLDTAYRAEAVGEFLFQCYLNAGEALLEANAGSLDDVKAGVAYFGQALAIHPRNRSASDARRLGTMYLDALQAMALGDREQARGQLTAVVAESPAYAGGQAARRLYELTVATGREALAAGDVPKALEQFSRAQGLPVSDSSAAQEGAALARAATPTSSPTPPKTATATLAPTPWAVAQGGPITARSGPESTYPVAGEVAQGATLTITGRREDGAWLRVCCTTDGKEAWVPSRLLQVSGPLNRAEVVSLPTATPGPTKAPRNTATPKPNLCLQGNVLNVAGSQPLAGWTVHIVDASGATKTLRSSASGFYRFTDLPAGPATVTIEAPGGWRSVSPVNAAAVVAAGPVCAVVDFWGEAATSGPAPQPTPIR